MWNKYMQPQASPSTPNPPPSEHTHTSPHPPSAPSPAYQPTRTECIYYNTHTEITLKQKIYTHFLSRNHVAMLFVMCGALQ